MVDLYIYYRVRDEHAADLEPRVRAMQARILASDGIAGQLKRRPPADGGLQTWMEIYPGAKDGFEALIGAAVQEAGLSELIDGARHTEAFMDFSCA